MDRKTVIAVVLCLLFLVLYKPLLDRFGLGGYLSPARPTAVVDTTASRAGDSTLAAGVPETPAAGIGEPSVAAPVLSDAPAPTSVLERSYSIETPFYHAVFSNRGARLVSFELKRYGSAHGVSGGKGLRKLKRGEEVPPGDRVVLAGGPLIALDLGSRDRLRSLANLVYAVEESLDAGAERVDAGMLEPGLAVRQPARGGRRRTQRARQLRDLVHEPVMVPARPVPLEHQELGVVEPPLIAGAEHVAELVDRPAARGEQPLHRELGRGLQPASVGGAQRVDVDIHRRVARGHRRVHLEHAALHEKSPGPREERGPGLERFE